MLAADCHFLQIGLGSMGKRRIRNLLFLNVPKEHIVGFDKSPERGREAKEKYGIKVCDSITEAYRERNPDAYIISTPPDKHKEYFLEAARLKKHFFTEISTSDAGYEELFSLLDGTFVAAPSCTFRYFPAVKKIREIVRGKRLGKVLFFQWHNGQYLPDWHPWEDYRQVYFAQKETGACREIFGYDLIWLTDLFSSPVRKVGGFAGKVSNLEMAADDLYVAVVQLENSIVGSLVIDVLSRAAKGTLKIIGSEGSLEWEWFDYEIKIYDANKKEWEIISLTKGESEAGYLTTEDMYREEINYFLKAVEGRASYPYTFQEDHRILKSVFALNESSKTEKIINV